MSTNPLRFFSTERDGDTLIAVPDSSVRSLAGAEFVIDRAALIEAIRQPEVRAIVVDFANVPYFGSLLLDTLCMAWKHARECGAGMALCNLSAFGDEILRKAKLNVLWPVYPTREQAVAALRKASDASGAASRRESRAKTPAPTDLSHRLQVLQTEPCVVIGFGGRDLPPEHVLGQYLGEIGELLDRTGSRELAFEMEGVVIIPSGFLGVIASITKRGVAVSVRHPSKDVREVLELTHFDQIVKIEPAE
jgi:anti-sigma B factor antagonist